GASKYIRKVSRSLKNGSEKILFHNCHMTPKESKVFDHLSRFVSEHKKALTERILAQRTRYVTVVLENIYQSQNASACIRTCECMGLQDIHIVEDTSKYQLNIRVLKGSHKWMSLQRYRDRNVNNIE